MYFFTFNIIRPEGIVWFALPWNLKIITHMLRHKIEARSLILRTKFCPSQGNERDNLARVKFGADWTTRWSRYQCPVWWQKAGINCQNIHVFGEQRPNYVQWFISCLNTELFTVSSEEWDFLPQPPRSSSLLRLLSRGRVIVTTLLLSSNKSRPWHGGGQRELGRRGQFPSLALRRCRRNYDFISPQLWIQTTQ